MSPADAAAWMLSEYQEAGYLYQETAAYHFFEVDDDTLSYFDRSGNLCLSRKVLAEFRKLTPDAVFERRDKFWRPRLPTDDEGRR